MSIEPKRTHRVNFLADHIKEIIANHLNTSPAKIEIDYIIHDRRKVNSTQIILQVTIKEY